MRCWALIVAANTTAASEALLYRPIGSRALLAWTLRAFDRASSVESIIVITSAHSSEHAKNALAQACCNTHVTVLVAESERRASVEKALALVPEEVDLVVLHEGARPLVTPRLIDNVIERAGECGAVLAALPARGTVLEGDKLVKRTLRSGEIWLAQTPQAFSRKLLTSAYAAFAGPALDEATVVERQGNLMAIMPGEEDNIRVASEGDLVLADTILRAQLSGMPQGAAVTTSGAAASTAGAPGRARSMATPATPRSGIGFEGYALVEGRRLVLGGMVIPHPKGLDGPGDADVLCRATADALLGAAGLGDLKRRFPANDPNQANAYSAEQLRQVAADVRDAGFEVGNVDAILLGEASVLSRHLPGMGDNLARALKINNKDVSLKAATDSAFGKSADAQSITAFTTALLLPIAAKV